jgi:phage terminase large subunit
MSVLMTGPTKIKHKPIAIFNPLPWQIAPWRDLSPILLLTGSAGGGKSRLAAEKILAFCWKYPRSMAVMLRKTRESMMNSTVLFMERTVIANQVGVRHFNSKNRFEYANGSILAYGGMKDEEQREQIRSIGQEGRVDIVWMEEATKFKEDDYQEVLARMRGTAAPWRQVILSTNPSHPQHWIHQRLMLGGEASIHYSKAADNPHNPPEYLETLGRLTGILAQRLRDGKWVQAEGIVYPEFDEDNLTDNEPDPERPIELGVDDGYVNPRAILFIQRTDNEILVFDEIYHSKHLPEVCVAETVERVQSWPWPLDDQVQEDLKELIARKLPEIAICPSEAVELRKRFRDADIPVRKGTHKIVEGIKLVRSLILDGQGYRTLKVNRRCTNLINEIMGGYKYPELGSKRDDENPIDENNHACDAFRYWAWVRAKT